MINAEDAARMFPQGHSDAYGHYRTTLKGYYSLLMNSYFDWVPRIEAVNVLGQPVSVDYQDERKFAAAAALARAGRQVFDLTWRKDDQPVHTVGWDHLSATRANSQRSFTVGGTNQNTVRHWGLDHWACRTGQGTYLNWIVGNAILPDVDPNPAHEGIQKIDRTTVPESKELATAAEALQTALDNAEGGLSNLQEYLAGTYDFDPQDGFRLDIVGLADGRPQLEFMAIRGRTYTLLGSADLETWTPIEFRIADGSPTAPWLRTYSATDVRLLRIEAEIPAGQQIQVFKIQAQ